LEGREASFDFIKLTNLSSIYFKIPMLPWFQYLWLGYKHFWLDTIYFLSVSTVAYHCYLLYHICYVLWSVTCTSFSLSSISYFILFHMLLYICVTCTSFDLSVYICSLCVQ
jgi:hypothetical protein